MGDLLNQPGGMNFLPPVVEFRGAVLAGAPSQAQLAAHFCPQVVPDPFGVSGGAAVLCRGFFGRAPTPAEMTVAFDLQFKVRNPNQVPVPLAEILTGVTVFPGATNQNLGAVCIKLCPPEQPSPSCAGQPDATSCQSSSRDIRSINDFANAATNLLITSGLALAAGQQPTFTAPRVSAAAEMDVTVRFAFGAEAMLPVLRQLAAQSMNELKAGRTITFNIPYRLEGTIWADAGSLGRVAAGYGPVTGTWQLPTEGILPH
ncbi:MAG TPA: hypothetical protein VFH73_18540 [Polyangia bacterium]|jgi:hypothetical protein|nr:hypothetical protein [Polyangia bacterium]